MRNHKKWHQGTMFSSFVKSNVIFSALPNIFAGLSSSLQWYEVVLGMRGV
jgi:hypothetical protein